MALRRSRISNAQVSISIDEVIRTHEASVRAYAFSLLRNPALLDDVMQETFIRVWRYLPSYRGEGSFEGWIIRICRNVCLSTMKKNPSLEMVEATAVSEIRDDFAESDIMEIISSLQRDFREVAMLCIVMGYSYEDAADAIGVPIGTVRSRLSRARGELRARMTPKDNFTNRRIVG